MNRPEKVAFWVTLILVCATLYWVITMIWGVGK